MKNKRSIISIVLLCIVSVAIVASVFIFEKDTEYIAEVDRSEVETAYQLLRDSLRTSTPTYSEFLSGKKKELGLGSYVAEPIKGTKKEDYDGMVQKLNYNEVGEYEIEVDKPGAYYLILDYRPSTDTLANFTIDVKVNNEQIYNEMKSIGLVLNWEDESKEYPLDRYGDEAAPRQVRYEGWKSLPLYNSTYSIAEPLLFNLESGKNIIKITNVSGDGLEIGKLEVEAPKTDIVAYDEYLSELNGSLVTTLQPVNSIDYVSKNTTQAIYGADNNPALTPHDSEYKLLNTLSWEEVGSEVVYEMEAPEDGFYNIAFHYKNTKEEISVFNTIKIDGEVPFKELMNYPFQTTGSKWENEVLSDEEGKPYQIYLTKGTHTMAIRAEQEPITQAWEYARLISEHIAQFELDITKITGSEKDQNRTWKMTRFIPEIEDYLNAYAVLIDEIRYSLQDYTTRGINSAILSDLDRAMVFIEKLSKYPDEIALHRDELAGRDNSILAAMSNFSTILVSQNFTLDMIYLYGNTELPAANKSLVKRMGNSFDTLINSFTSDKYSTENDPDVLNIWVNRAITHVDLLQKMVDTEFTPKTGIKVKISIMPDVNKLTLAAAAGETPDVALGLPSHMPFELASRDALYDMTKFEDFWTVADRFSPGAFVPYLFNEGIYAIPESGNFNAVVYRTDVFDSLELAPPGTWQEVVDMLPVLQRYGKNFYHNISSGSGYKWFHQTAPFIFQNNGELYMEDGVRTALDKPDSVKGLKALGDLFISYSLDREVISFFNSFRYSILPVGIVDLDEYILIKNGAPELEGQWALAPYPGTEQEDGSISRWFVANGTGGIIFDDTERADEAWEFLKWWTDYDAQVNYAYTLQSTFGKQYMWLSSNIEAVADSPFDQEDKRIIVEQLKWLRDVPRTPGQYLLERSISDIWNDMVLDGESAQVAIDDKVIAINREIRKKMQEIGYSDEDGNLIKPYVIRDVDWIIEQIEKARKGAE